MDGKAAYVFTPKFDSSPLQHSIPGLQSKEYTVPIQNLLKVIT